MIAQLDRHCISGHAFFVGVGTRTASHLWATLAMRRTIESVIFDRYGARLSAELRRQGHIELARLVGEELDSGVGEQRSAELEAAQTPVARAVTSCAVHTLACALGRNLRSAGLHGRLGSYYAVKLVQAMLIAHSGSLAATLELGGDAQRWSSFRDRVELDHARACLQIPTRLSTHPELVEQFWRNAASTLDALCACLDTLAELRRDTASSRRAKLEGAA